VASETGWPESQIVEMPMVRVFAYFHAALRYAGSWTVRDKHAPQPEDESLSRLTTVAMFEAPDEDDLL
jgi:hypothetical protein